MSLRIRHYYRWLALTHVVTLTTHPAASLPCGVDHAGMPFGSQINGPFHGDRKTLAVAHAMEQVFDQSPALRRPRPDLSMLAQAAPSL
jgi:amidase